MMPVFHVALDAAGAAWVVRLDPAHEPIGPFPDVAAAEAARAELSAAHEQETRQ